MNKFENGDSVYWDFESGVYVGQDPYDPYASYVIEVKTQSLLKVDTLKLSREPAMSLREANGKALMELIEETWIENIDRWTPSTWDAVKDAPEVKEAYMRLAEKLNYVKG